MIPFPVLEETSHERPPRVPPSEYALRLAFDVAIETRRYVRMVCV